MSDSLFHLAVATLDRAALALIIGAVAARLVFLPLPDMPDRTAAAVTRLLAVALALFACSSVGDLVLRTAALADVAPGEAWPYIGQALTHSDYGTFWQIRAAAWLALVALLPAAARTGRGVMSWVLAAGAATLIFAMSSTGHAGSAGSLALPNAVNTLHIAGAGLWGGTVAIYVLTILPRLCRGGAPAATVAGTATRLSTLAGAALALVLATGVYSAWRQLGDWPALWTTAYGNVLLVKLAAVGVMMAIGAANRFFLVPAIETWARTADAAETPVLRFLRVLRADTAVFVFVLAGAAALGSQVPPAHMANTSGNGTETPAAPPEDGG